MKANEFNEPVMTLVEAAGWLERRFGRRPNAATIWRWAIKGLRGVRLRTISLGRYRYTTEQALEHFIADTSSSKDERRLSDQPARVAAGGDHSSFTEPQLTAARRRREAAKAKAKEFLRQNIGSCRSPGAKRA